MTQYCDECRGELPADYTHSFAGYGFYVRYCAVCCPKTMDGSNCDYDHPPENTNPEPEADDDT